MSGITEHEAQQIEKATRRGVRRWCSSTDSGSCRAAGTAGRLLPGGRLRDAGAWMAR